MYAHMVQTFVEIIFNGHAQRMTIYNYRRSLFVYALV